MSALARLPAWPAALTRAEALEYTRVGEALMRDWERAGKVRFRARGHKGALITLKADLDAALLSLFGAPEDQPIKLL
jgi:hypothetical protein